VLLEDLCCQCPRAAVAVDSLAQAVTTQGCYGQAAITLAGVFQAQCPYSGCAILVAVMRVEHCSGSYGTAMAWQFMTHDFSIALA
jgi:hypothetical protein